MPDADSLLVDFVVASATSPLPADVRDKIALHLVDAVALGLAAREHPVVQAVSTLHAGTAATTGEAVSWTSGRTLPIPDACFANAVAAHAHFQDDTDMVAWAHPGSLIVPVPAALAGGRGLGTGAVLRGIATGYATLTWLAAEQHVARAMVERGFRAGPTLGSVAAAAAAAATLRLDAEAIRSAIGIAADSTGALLEPVRAGAQDWRLQNATAAMRGAQAAVLAEAGVVGPPAPLTGERGLLWAFTGSAAAPARWSTPPDLADVHRTWFKALPTLGDNMAVAVAAQQLHHDVLAHRSAPHVDRVVVEMNAHFAAYPGTAFRGPYASVDQAVASTAFAVAALLVRGALQYADYPTLLRDADVLALVDRVEIVPSHALDYVSGAVTVHLGDEHVRREAADAPREVFFRDRVTAHAAAAEQVGPAAGPVVDRFFAELDGTQDEHAVSELIEGLRSAAS